MIIVNKVPNLLQYRLFFELKHLAKVAFFCRQITIWNVHISDDEIRQYMTTGGLQWPKHQQIISAHYHMDEAGAPELLHDDSGHGNNGEIINGKWVEVREDLVNFFFAT